ncbi:catalase [Mycobacteroides chelonae]|nr:catalase [Mycobacteroides chelonae]
MAGGPRRERSRRPGQERTQLDVRGPGPDVGTLALGHAILPEQEHIRDTNFDPTLLPKGIELSDDPILAAVYAESHRRRARETPAPVEQFGQDM